MVVGRANRRRQSNAWQIVAVLVRGVDGASRPLHAWPTSSRRFRPRPSPSPTPFPTNLRPIQLPYSHAHPVYPAKRVRRQKNRLHRVSPVVHCGGQPRTPSVMTGKIEGWTARNPRTHTPWRHRMRARRSERPMHAIVAVKVLEIGQVPPRGANSTRTRVQTSCWPCFTTPSPQLQPSRAIDSVTVVTPDPTVAALAYSRRRDGLRRSSSRRRPKPTAQHRARRKTLNAALSAAAADIRAKRGVVDLVVLQADLPAMQPSELTEAVAAARSGGRSVVVDHHGTGTSALFACGESALDPRFGPESALGHANSGARPLNGQWPGLRTDVDTHADLGTVRALGVGPATSASLTRLKATPSNSR